MLQSAEKLPILQLPQTLPLTDGTNITALFRPVVSWHRPPLAICSHTSDFSKNNIQVWSSDLLLPTPTPLPPSPPYFARVVYTHVYTFM